MREGERSLLDARDVAVWLSDSSLKVELAVFVSYV